MATCDEKVTAHWNKIPFIVACIVLSLVSPSESIVKSPRDDVTEETLDSKQGAQIVLQATCSDYPSCQLDLQLLKKAVDTRNMGEACGHVRASFQCQRSATKLCEKEGVVSNEALVKMKRAYIYTEIYMQEMCHSGHSPDSTVFKGGSHCSEFRSCFVDVKKYKAAAQSEMFFEACSIANFIYKCSTSAMLDCKRRGSVSREALELMKDATLQAGFRVDSICAYTTSTAPPPPQETYQCFDYANCPTPDLDVIQIAKRTGQFDEACSTTLPYSQCLEEAVRDCEAKELVSGIALLSMKETLEMAKNDVKMFCPFFESRVIKGQVFLAAPESGKDSVATFDLRTTAPPITCLEIGSCPRPANAHVGKSERDYKKACKSMQVHTKCIDYATNDCEDRHLITGPALEAMVRAVMEAREITAYFCDKAQERGRGNGDEGQTNNGYTVQPGYHVIAIIASIIFIWSELHVSIESIFALIVI